MKRLATACLAATTLAHSSLTLAASTPADTHALPSAYAPRPHGGSHVYGAPIDPPIVGHAAPPPERLVPTRQPAKSTKLHARDRKAKSRRSAMAAGSVTAANK
jgi:hypothetical protein